MRDILDNILFLFSALNTPQSFLVFVKRIRRDKGNGICRQQKSLNHILLEWTDNWVERSTVQNVILTYVDKR